MNVLEFAQRMGRYPTSGERFLCKMIGELRAEIDEIRREVRAAHYPPLPDDSPLQRAFEVHEVPK